LLAAMQPLTGTDMPTFDTLIVDVHLATMEEGGEPYGVVRDAALGVSAGRIAWLGPASALPGEPADHAERVLRGGGAWVTPGLIDCHTHLVFGGDRVDEFERRLQGATYEEIARAGGGIRSTVRRTRAATEDALLESARARLGRLVQEGVTTVEIKSGYGLDEATELRMLRVARALGRSRAVDVRATLLAAHALPEEHAHDREGYLRLVCDALIPRVATEGLAEAVDAFCERIAFSAEECARVFEAARAHSLRVKLHADQLSDGGGAQLAARFGALSADHLEHTSAAGARALGEAGTTAVLLPGAYYFLREAKAPPVDTLREERVALALGSDLNPGSSPVQSLLLVLNMGCVLFRLTPEESLAAVTRSAARALGLADDRGTLAVGKRADLALWNVGHPAELSYWIGGNPLRLVMKDGVPRTSAEAALAL
jgi:imidazolonepropionase